MISSSEAIWLHNSAGQSAIYSASVVIRETPDCFLPNHELKADPKQKYLLDVLFLSEILPAQSASIYTHGCHHSIDQSLQSLSDISSHVLQLLGEPVLVEQDIDLRCSKKMYGLVFFKYINDSMICL